MAAAYLETEEAEPEPVERFSDWTAERWALADVVDRIGSLIQATVAAAGGHPARMEPSLRPATAVDRLRKQRRVDVWNRVTGAMTFTVADPGEEDFDSDWVPPAEAHTAAPEPDPTE